MTDAEKNALNGQIACALYGWTQNAAGQWVDPTGDAYVLAPNYVDNSGLVIGLEYKLRVRGFDIAMQWIKGAQVTYALTKGATFTGMGDTQSNALSLAIQSMLTVQPALVKK